MRSRYTYLLLLLACFLAHPAFAQTSLEGFPLRGTLADLNGNYYSQTNLTARVGVVNNDNGTLIYEETQAVITDDYGLYELIIGEGTSTGAGTENDLSAVDFTSGDYNLRLEINVNGAGYEMVSFGRLWAVPYAEHAGTIAQSIALNTHTNLDTSGISTNHILVWDGTGWSVGSQGLVQNAIFAHDAENAAFADTVAVGYSNVTFVYADTVLFSFELGNVNYATTAQSAIWSDTVSATEDASYAATIYSWNTDGNAIDSGNFLGSTNNEPLLFYTNNAERMRISSAGELRIGQTSGTATWASAHDDGFRLNTDGSGVNGVDVDSGDWFYWHAGRANLMVGNTFDTLWHDSNAGTYSFVHGNHSWTNSDYSQAWGDSCVVTRKDHPYNLSPGRFSLAVGKHSQANGAYSFGGGLRTEARTTRSVAMGADCVTLGGYAAVALGNKAVADGIFEPAFAVGYNVDAGGQFSTAMGYNVDLGTRIGGFAWGDYQPLDTFFETQSWRFSIRASGGTIIYSDDAATAGVYLLANGGAWNSVSDRTKKRNIMPLHNARISEQLLALPISEWQYISQNGVRHIGPMAQDFYRVFGFGESDTTITTTDIDGVIFGGIQQVNQQLDETQSTINNIEASDQNPDYQGLNDRLDALEQRMEALKEKDK